MPGGQERTLRRRINSVQSTKQITRAMELIAATRVVKAMTRANAARPYAAKMTGVIEDLASGGVGVDDPLLRSGDPMFQNKIKPFSRKDRSKFLNSLELELQRVL